MHLIVCMCGQRGYVTRHDGSDFRGVCENRGGSQRTGEAHAKPSALLVVVLVSGRAHLMHSQRAASQCSGSKLEIRQAVVVEVVLSEQTGHQNSAVSSHWVSGCTYDTQIGGQSMS